jgi:hypothetical protein
MKTIKKIVLLTALLLVGVFVVNAQIPDEIVMGIRSGNAAKLSKYFNQNVELLVLDFECSCSKSQAQQVVNDFFIKSPPTKFTIIHQGGKGDSNYAIGSLETQNGKYRVYFLIKTINQVSFIHQFRIEVLSN